MTKTERDKELKEVAEKLKDLLFSLANMTGRGDLGMLTETRKHLEDVIALLMIMNNHLRAMNRGE